MTQFHVFSALTQPGLHVWKPSTNLDLFLSPAQERSSMGGWRFHCELGDAPLEEIRCQIFAWGSRDEMHDWEHEALIKTVPREADGRLPPIVYLFHGAARAVTRDPFAAAHSEITVHLLTASKYVNARLYMWGPTLDEPTWLDQLHAPGLRYPTWRVPLSGGGRSAFLFKFFRPVDNDWRAEGDYANRVWVAEDGAEIWVHSESREVLTAEPVMQPLRVFFRQEIDAAYPPSMHVWELGSDFVTDVAGTDAGEGWTRHEVDLYTGLPYHFKFWNPTKRDAPWEHDEVERTIRIAGPTDRWTLEGDGHLFADKPERNGSVALEIGPQPPGFEIRDLRGVEVWVNRARAALIPSAALAFDTYPEVLTSFRLYGADGAESVERHYVRAEAGAPLHGFVVPGRPPILRSAPAADLFADPPFLIKRPGAYEADGQLRFVLHAPWCARVDVEGEWMPAGTTLPMRSTVDGTYWWAEIPVADVLAGLHPAGGGDYHGARYRFQLNGEDGNTVEDPAAAWVEGSAPGGWSRLVRSSRYSWRSTNWQTPAFDWLALYQLHPRRFSARGPAGTAFDRVAWELASASGHLHALGVTTIQLMPVNEVGTNNSWGYDPAFYYAVEEDYGGPDGLKALVDTCHENGRAVLLDVIFNHAGTTDNILWKTAQGTFFDGDTDWGAMINYDHPQVIHFFEQNLVFLLEEYRVDGIRFDFTRVITHGDVSGEAHVRRPGSGGGWEFLQKMRAAMHSANPRAILIAEHLPNEWSIVNYGGSMDSEWCDDFHDRLLSVCSGNPGDIPKLADALKLSHTAADNWYKVTNYAESHDEVGNVPGRIAWVGGPGRGLRLSKVAMCVTLLSRGIPMLFMGEEASEYRQFSQGSVDTLDLDYYSSDVQARRLRDWTNALLALRNGNANLQGPAPLAVVYAQDGQLAFARGQAGEYFIVVNFTSWAGWKSLRELNLPDGMYREMWNSTWPAFQVEWEDEHTNGGRDARLRQDNWLQIPDYGAIVLERV